MEAGIQLSTAISDGVLALVTLATALPVLRSASPTRRFGAICLSLIGLTAAVGAARFAGVDVARLHDGMSWTSRMIVLPALGAAFVALAFGFALTRLYWYGLCFALTAASWALPPALGLAPGVLAMVGILVFVARRARADRGPALAAGLGVAATLIAGLAIGTTGMLGPMPRIDAFHYLLAAGNAAFAYALARAAE